MAVISWVGTVASIVGSFLVAFGILGVGYVLFLVGSLAWLFVAVYKKDMALGSLNGVFFAANIVGLYTPFV